MHVIAAKAVAFKEALQPEFKTYQRQIVANAKALAGESHRARLPAADRRHRQSPDDDGSPRQRADRQGRRGDARPARITVNKNTVPFDPRSPMVTSGVRIGTPAVTSRGMREPEMAMIGDLIARALSRVGDEAD
jgi:glycine hydroxymethyltransferase